MPQVVAQTVSPCANRLILLDVRLLHNAAKICSDGGFRGPLDLLRCRLGKNVRSAGHYCPCLDDPHSRRLRGLLPLALDSQAGSYQRNWDS
jgi:hypothetical protein